MIKNVCAAVAVAGLLAGCHTPPQALEIVTIQYDPNNYDQTQNYSAAVAQCRAKGYATATPHPYQPNMSASTWSYQAFACVAAR